MQSLNCGFVGRRIFSTAVLVLSAFAPVSWAADASYDFLACGHSKSVPLESSAEFTASGAESWGIVASSTTKEWESATTRCVGYSRVMAGKFVGKGVCKWIFASGDTALGEWEVPATGEASFTWLVGTGKLKGITGGGSFKYVTRGKPSEPGTSQWCRHDWGKYTLP